MLLSRSGRALRAGFIALSFFIASAVIFSVEQQTSDAVVRRALGIEIELADLLSALQDAEIGQRGFLITDAEQFLQPYHAAVEKLDRQLEALGAAVSGIAEQQDHFAKLKSLVFDKRDELARTLTLHQTGRQDEALTLVRNGQGKRVMDDIRQQIEAMDAHEEAVVEQREAALRRTGLITEGSIIVAVGLLGLVAWSAMREVRRRAELSRFLPPEVAPRLAAGDEALRQGRERSVAIVFIDIRGSSRLAEHLPTADFSRLLAGFRGAVITAAGRHGGLVDKFIGDGALVVFGAHDDTAKPAGRALAFSEDLLTVTKAGPGDPSYAIGIGAHYGRAFCGIVAAADRHEFTVLGDAVNVAARLQDETKTFGVDLLISHDLLQATETEPRSWRSLGPKVLRGREEAVELYTANATAARLAEVDQPSA